MYDARKFLRSAKTRSTAVFAPRNPCIPLTLVSNSDDQFGAAERRHLYQRQPHPVNLRAPAAALPWLKDTYTAALFVPEQERVIEVIDKNDKINTDSPGGRRCVPRLGILLRQVKYTGLTQPVPGLMLCASVDDEQSESSLAEVKSQIKLILRRLNRNSEQQASIESGNYTLHYLIANDIVFLCICDRSYPRKLAFTYLSDLSAEFSNSYSAQQLHSPALRPYAFMEFDTFINRTKATYADTRATQNLDKLNDELRDVTKVMTKNIEDLLYRGDSLERMGEMSSRLRDDSKKYRKAAVKINWDLLLKQYAPIGIFGVIVLLFIWFRFF
ncbi:hypothetical protein CHU98_g8347 [Xylaria longipes]|nr:hypothetical protein CHU98_g8347 [Xylaria longipes]